MAARQQTTVRPDRGRKPILITIDEAAQYLRFHPSTVYRLARRGELPAVKVGKQWRLDRKVLENWLRANIGSLGSRA
jgi:excisionase family DNA binding protein